MASTEEYRAYVLNLLVDVPAVTTRKMMGEYLLYSDGVLFGGIYDDRFLMKVTESSRRALTQEAIPYDVAKPMMLVDIEDRAEIAAIVACVIAELS